MELLTLSEHLLTVLADFPGISLVYLFGSQVTGRVGPMSDVDLAIVDDSGQDELVIQAQFQYAISKFLNDDRVDVVLLHRAPIELAYQVIATGKLLYKRDLYSQVEFEAMVLGKHGDYLPTLNRFQLQTNHGEAHVQRVQRYREAFERTQRTLSQIGSSPKPPSH